MSKRYFSIVETVNIQYSCYLPENFEGTIVEYVEQYGLGKLFECSTYEEILDYLESDESSISEN